MTQHMPEKQTPRSLRRQERIARFIVAFTDGHGYPPTAREIGREFDMVPSQVHLNLRLMERSGMIARRPNTARSLRVLQMKAPEVQL